MGGKQHAIPAPWRYRNYRRHSVPHWSGNLSCSSNSCDIAGFRHFETFPLHPLISIGEKSVSCHSTANRRKLFICLKSRSTVLNEAFKLLWCCCGEINVATYAPYYDIFNERLISDHTLSWVSCVILLPLKLEYLWCKCMMNHRQLRQVELKDLMALTTTIKVCWYSSPLQHIPLCSTCVFCIRLPSTCS